MNIQQLMSTIEAVELTQGMVLSRQVQSGYVCDLLSWVMARGDAGSAWITVQTHMNVVAVASLHDMACIILPENITMEEEPLNKAMEENIPVLSTPLSAYDICGRMAQAGIPSPLR